MRGVAVGLCVLALAGCGGSETKPLLASGKTAVVRGTLTPDVHLFAEPVVARIEVILRRDAVDPKNVRVKTDFAPYESVGTTTVARDDIGGFTHLRYTTTLRCLGPDCIPRTVHGSQVTVPQTSELPLFPETQQRDEKRTYEFPPAIVTVGAASEAKTVGRVVWPPLRSLSRINWDDPSVVGQGFPFASDVTPLPKPTYRVSPTVFGLGLLAAALLLLAVPTWLVVHRLRRRVSREAESGPALTPLERALALVEWASRRPSIEERREALEPLAHELESDDADGKAALAREQGWSPPTPATEDMSALVTSIREEDAPSS
jgi:hypothetical protein